MKSILHKRGIHLRRWLNGLLAYSRYLGYVKPQLMTTAEEEFLVRRKLLARAWEPRHLTPPVGKRILALCPHPDDETIGAGGLLLAHRDLAEIHLVCLCNGEGGGKLNEPGIDVGTAKNKLVETRKAEFAKTAKVLKAASVRHLGFPDGGIPCSAATAEQLRSVVRAIQPDVVLLPWFLDNQVDHRRANVLYAWACADSETMMVLGYEIWSMLEPNAVFDISQHLSAKLSLIQNYASQLRMVDYASYAAGLARVRAYHAALSPQRSGAAEAFLALPNHEYCELVCELYGSDGRVRDNAATLLDVAPSKALMATK